MTHSPCQPWPLASSDFQQQNHETHQQLQSNQQFYIAKLPLGFSTRLSLPSILPATSFNDFQSFEKGFGTYSEKIAKFLLAGRCLLFALPCLANQKMRLLQHPWFKLFQAQLHVCKAKLPLDRPQATFASSFSRSTPGATWFNPTASCYKCGQGVKIQELGWLATKKLKVPLFIIFPARSFGECSPKLHP